MLGVREAGEKVAGDEGTGEITKGLVSLDRNSGF